LAELQLCFVPAT